MDILLIEDDEMVFKTLEWVFPKGMYHLRMASDGLEALQLLKARKPDAIIANFGLAERGSIDLLDIFRTRFPHTPVVVLSDRGNADVRLKALRGGAYDYIQKPIRVQELLEVLMRIERGREPTLKG